MDNGKIPFYRRADRLKFREITMGHVVIMGRKTWDSIPLGRRPLVGRDNFVLTTTLDEVEGARIADSIESLQSQLKQEQFAAKKWFVIGGAQLYDAFYERGFVGEIHLSQINGSFNCDVRVFFLQSSDWLRSFQVKQEHILCPSCVIYRYFEKRNE